MTDRDMFASCVICGGVEIANKKALGEVLGIKKFAQEQKTKTIRRRSMKYNIKVGEKYLVGENMHETLKGTVTGDTTAVYSRFVGEMSAYDFCETVDEACCFDLVTACDYIRGIMDRQNYGFYLGDIKVFDADHEETIVHCKHEENAKVIARILDLDEQDTFLVEEEIWGKDAVCEDNV